MTWQMGPTMLTCQLTGHWHGMPTVYADVILIRVWHVGQVVWYSGRVSPSGWRRRVWHVACVCELGQQPCRHVTARENVADVWCRHCFHQWLRLFLLYTVVWSKHNFDNFYFWAKIKHNFKLYALIPIVGDSGSPCADRWCTDSCPKKAKHTNTIFNVVRQIAYIHGKSQYY